MAGQKGGMDHHPLYMVPMRAFSGCSHRGTTRGAKAVGATKKGLSPSQHSSKQAGMSWAWEERFRGQPSISNPSSLQPPPGL